jgi:hypothetical protein
MTTVITEDSATPNILQYAAAILLRLERHAKSQQNRHKAQEEKILTPRSVRKAQVMFVLCIDF